MRIGTWTDEELQRMASTIKEAVVEALGRNDELKRETGKVQMEYQVVLQRKGFFGKMFDKFFGEPEKNSMAIKIVKPV